LHPVPRLKRGRMEMGDPIKIYRMNSVEIHLFQRQ